MIRINLIPPETLQSRKDEARWKWVWIGGVLVLAVVVLFWGVMSLEVGGAKTDVASVQQQAATLQSQTSRFQIFQAKEADLNARTSAVDAATTGRIDWARMLDELGLVLPTDVYLTSFTGTDAGSGASGSAVTLAGQAVDEPDDTPDHGYKSIATMLVRLADMRQLDSVWLTNMSLGQGTESAAPMITWSANARVTPSTTSTAN